MEEGYLFSTKHPKDIVFFKGSIHIQEFNQRDEKTAVDYDEDDDDDDDDWAYHHIMYTAARKLIQFWCKKAHILYTHMANDPTWQDQPEDWVVVENSDFQQDRPQPKESDIFFRP